MRGKVLTVACVGILSAIGVVHRASAGCSAELQVTAGPSRIYFYSQTGQYLGEIQRNLALRQRALDCDERYGLIKVQLTDRRIVWIPRKEADRVRLASCNSSVPSPNGGHIGGTGGTAGTSGVGPRC